MKSRLGVPDYVLPTFMEERGGLTFAFTVFVLSHLFLLLDQLCVYLSHCFMFLASEMHCNFLMIDL